MNKTALRIRYIEKFITPIIISSGLNERTQIIGEYS